MYFFWILKISQSRDPHLVMVSLFLVIVESKKMRREGMDSRIKLQPQTPSSLADYEGGDIMAYTP